MQYFLDKRDKRENFHGVRDLIMLYNEYLMTSENLYFLFIQRKAIELSWMDKEKEYDKQALKKARISNEI